MFNIIKEGELGGRPSWDEYFMKIAIAAASRASCWKVNAGSVLTIGNRIIGTGYNGAPSGVKNCLERGGCYKEMRTGSGYEDTMNTGNCIGVHGEINALAHVSGLSQRGFTLYSTIMPCNTCTKNLIANGIKRMVFKRGYDGREFDNAMRLFEEAGVEVVKLDLSPERCVDIDFNHPNVLHDIWTEDERIRIREILGCGKGDDDGVSAFSSGQ